VRLKPQRLPISPKCNTERWVKGAKFITSPTFGNY
jgi:hypothetical protein